MASLLAACSVPPRETDRSTPEGCFRTFRGAIARAEYEREYDCLSDHLKTQLGIATKPSLALLWMFGINRQHDATGLHDPQHGGHKTVVAIATNANGFLKAQASIGQPGGNTIHLLGQGGISHLAFLADAYRYGMRTPPRLFVKPCNNGW